MADSAYQWIRAAILICHFTPGSMVFATELAEQLKMSPAPVHEALKRLCHEGFATVRPHRGYVITEISERDIKENFELRLSVEVLGAGLAAARATTEDVESLYDWIARGRERFAAADWRDPAFLQSVVASNTEFHVAVAAMADNQRLTRTVTGLVEENERTYYLYYRPFQPGEGHHAKILEAIAEKDPSRAREAMTAHLLSAQNRILYGAKHTLR